MKQPFAGLFQKSPLNANKDAGKTNQAAKTVVDAINKQVQGFPVIIYQLTFISRRENTLMS